MLGKPPAGPEAEDLRHRLAEAGRLLAPRDRPASAKSQGVGTLGPLAACVSSLDLDREQFRKLVLQLVSTRIIGRSLLKQTADAENCRDRPIRRLGCAAKHAPCCASCASANAESGCPHLHFLELPAPLICTLVTSRAKRAIALGARAARHGETHGMRRRVEDQRVV